MKIGTRKLQIGQPVDLEQELLDLTGCSPAEVREQLAHPCLASAVASALIPFVKDPPSRQELAQAIAAHGVNEIRAQVRELYGKGSRGKK